MATNVHVSIPFNPPLSLLHPTMYLGYNNNYKVQASIPISLDSFFSVPFSNWTLLGHDNTTRPMIVPNATYGENSYECDVDFNVFDVNFGVESYVTHNDPLRSQGTPLLDRLRKLNEVAQESNNQKIITPFEDSSYQVEHKTLHVGGFPLRPTTNNNSAAK
jgi:hypothetical protein